MMTSTQAHDIAQRIGADVGEDFHKLGASQVDRLLIEANARRYRAPRNKSGSRGRMFWQYVQRAAGAHKRA
jgi:hypothetical protein